MRECSVMIGGKAGEGINTAGLTIASLLNHLGYRVYMYFDYPSLIRGGHNFAVIRAAEEKIGATRDTFDILLALDQNCIDRHTEAIRDDTIVIYDSYQVVHATGHPLDVDRILKEENAPQITKNSILIGGFCKASGIAWEILTDVFGKTIPEKYLDVNLRVARRGYDAAPEVIRIEPLNRPTLPVLTGNQVAGLGLVRGGLDTFVAYPMTPTSNLLHFLAEHARDLSVKVIHPENEIGVMLMALGLAYAGDKTAVSTSGGGFCLMTEGLSLAGMSETPVTIVLGQRPGPSTGVPTYTAQGDLHFALNAGQGEFPRFVVVPGDLEEMYYWSAVALGLSWKYQIPSIVLTDKTLAEGAYTFEIDASGTIPEIAPVLADGKNPYRRYENTENGISPLAFPPESDSPDQDEQLRPRRGGVHHGGGGDGRRHAGEDAPEGRRSCPRTRDVPGCRERQEFPTRESRSSAGARRRRPVSRRRHGSGQRSSGRSSSHPSPSGSGVRRCSGCTGLSQSRITPPGSSHGCSGRTDFRSTTSC